MPSPKNKKISSPNSKPLAKVVTKEQSQTGNLPIFMILISTLQAIVFYFGGDYADITLKYDPHRRQDLWRYFSCTLLHSSYSVTVLWQNVIFPLIVGALFEISHNWKITAIIYFASTFGGVLTCTTFQPDNYLSGAPAGTYGLLFAHIGSTILNWDVMEYKYFRVFCLLPFIGYDAGNHLFDIFGPGSEGSTSGLCQLGSAVAGFLVSVLLIKTFEKDKWEARLQKVCAALLISLVCATVSIVIFLTYFTNFYTKTNSVKDVEYEQSLYILKHLSMLAKSPADSDLRMDCEVVAECKKALQKYMRGVSAIRI